MAAFDLVCPNTPAWFIADLGIAILLYPLMQRILRVRLLGRSKTFEVAACASVLLVSLLVFIVPFTAHFASLPTYGTPSWSARIPTLYLNDSLWAMMEYLHFYGLPVLILEYLAGTALAQIVMTLNEHTGLPDAKGAGFRGGFSGWPGWLPTSRSVLGDFGFLIGFVVFPLLALSNQQPWFVTHLGVFGVCLFLFGSCDSPSSKGHGMFAAFLRAPIFSGLGSYSLTAYLFQEPLAIAVGGFYTMTSPNGIGPTTSHEGFGAFGLVCYLFGLWTLSAGYCLYIEPHVLALLQKCVDSCSVWRGRALKRARSV